MAAVEIEVNDADEQDETCDCCPDCKFAPAAGPTESKDALLAQLKTLLNDNRANGMADRMLQIDKLMETISDMSESD